jgi:hypothetical protein
MAPMRIRGNRSSSTDKSWWPRLVLQHHIGGQRHQPLLVGCLSFDHLSKYPLLGNLVIQDSWVKKVLMGRGSSINVTFPHIFKALGISITDLHESDTPFFCIVPTEGEYLLRHASQP